MSGEIAQTAFFAQKISDGFGKIVKGPGSLPGELVIVNSSGVGISLLLVLLGQQIEVIVFGFSLGRGRSKDINVLTKMQRACTQILPIQGVNLDGI